MLAKRKSPPLAPRLPGLLSPGWFCVSTLAPSLFETLKLSSSDEYHLLQCPEHPHIRTRFVCSILLSPLIFRFYCVVRATSNACPPGRKPSLDRQTTSVIVTLQSTLSSRPTVHATYRLTLGEPRDFSQYVGAISHPSI